MSQVDRLAAMLAKLQKDVRDLQRAPQLHNSSLEGTLPMYDPANGRPIGAIGVLPDGSFGVGVYTGPVPPRPTKPVLAPVPGGLSVTWDGRFLDPASGAEVACPMDFTRVEVHLYKTAGGYDPVYSPMTTIESPRGGQVNAVPLIAGTTFYCVLVARNTSGGASAPSDEASAVAASFVSDAELAKIQTDLSANQTALTQANKDIQKAFTSADNAASAASIAQGTADSATQKAGAAITAANGKNKIFFASSAPTASAVGDTWFNSAEDNKPYTWDGSNWVPKVLGNQALGNIDAAKIATGYLAAARIEVGSLSGDKITANSIGADRIVANSITSDQIAANSIVGDDIRARTLGADRIQAGAITGYEIKANEITAQHITSDAITSKTITAGMFRTDYYGNDRIEIINEVQYDQYLGQYRNLRDTVRWLRGSDNALVGEIRGYMGDIGAYGLHLNSHMELGNTQSVIYQVGKRKAKNGPPNNVRVRANHVQVTVDANGQAYVGFDSAMTEAPTFVVCNVSTATASNETVVARPGSYSGNGFYVDLRILSGDSTRNGRAPGSGSTFWLSYYAEIVI